MSPRSRLKGSTATLEIKHTTSLLMGCVKETPAVGVKEAGEGEEGQGVERKGWRSSSGPRWTQGQTVKEREHGEFGAGQGSRKNVQSLQGRQQRKITERRWECKSFGPCPSHEVWESQDKRERVERPRGGA